MSSTTHFEVYQDGIGEFRWRLQAGNSRIVADSGEGYDREVDCWKAVHEMRVWAETAYLNLEPRTT